MKNIIMLLLMLIAGSIYAQEKQNTYYFKENGKQVQDKDSADYIRTISPPDSGETHYKLVEHYKNGKVKRIGYSTSLTSIKLEGLVKTFYINGNKMNVLNYQQNKLFGKAWYYHENGNLKEHRDYLVASEENDFIEEKHYKTLQVSDTTGRFFLDDLGNGFVKLENKTIRIQGEYKDGFKTGLWREYIIPDSSNYEEVYENGNFKSGCFINKSRDTIKYSVKEAFPEFKGGQQKFMRFLNQNLRYPSDARKNKIEGRVIINFVVEKDGSLSSFKILKSLYPSLDEETLRVMGLSPEWNPGLQKGRPVRVFYTLPILFSMN